MYLILVFFLLLKNQKYSRQETSGTLAEQPTHCVSWSNVGTFGNGADKSLDFVHVVTIFFFFFFIDMRTFVSKSREFMTFGPFQMKKKHVFRVDFWMKYRLRLYKRFSLDDSLYRFIIFSFIKKK